MRMLTCLLTQGISLTDGLIFVLYEATNMGYIRNNRKFKLCFAEHRFNMFFSGSITCTVSNVKGKFLKDTQLTTDMWEVHLSFQGRKQEVFSN